VFRRLFSGNRGPLEPPHSTRLRHYTAQNGYHYAYRHEGHRGYRSRTDSGTEFVFRISADRENGLTIVVFLSTGVLRAWEQTHAHEFSATERYAIAKMALFQAFDERSGPAELGDRVLVRAADLDAIVGRLSID